MSAQEPHGTANSPAIPEPFCTPLPAPRRTLAGIAALLLMIYGVALMLEWSKANLRDSIEDAKRVRAASRQYRQNLFHPQPRR